MRPEGHWTHYGNQIELGYRPILTIDPIKAKTIGTTTDFSYTGSYQEYIAKDNGYYKLECWGAQGAGSHQDGELGYAGRGGYSVGQLYLEKDEKLYVYVGGQGNARNSAGTVAGGYNGGGYGWKNTGGSRNPGASGGGATDIPEEERQEEMDMHQEEHKHQDINLDMGQMQQHQTDLILLMEAQELEEAGMVEK